MTTILITLAVLLFSLLISVLIGACIHQADRAVVDFFNSLDGGNTMDQLRHDLLQAELNRIEQEAEAKSYAIMNQADALLAAHKLCSQVNAIQPAFDVGRPSVCYYSGDNTASVLVHTLDDGDTFITRCQSLGLDLEVTGVAHEGMADVAVTGFKGVLVLIRDKFMPLITAAQEPLAA